MEAEFWQTQYFDQKEQFEELQKKYDDFKTKYDKFKTSFERYETALKEIAKHDNWIGDSWVGWIIELKI